MLLMSWLEIQHNFNLLTTITEISFGKSLESFGLNGFVFRDFKAMRIKDRF